MMTMMVMVIIIINKFAVMFSYFYFETDELIKEVQMGSHYSFVVLPSCEINESSVHFQCNPLFEVRCLKSLGFCG